MTNVYDLPAAVLQLKLGEIEGFVHLHGEAAHVAALDAARRMTETVEADFFRRSSDPANILREIEEIRTLLAHDCFLADANFRFRMLDGGLALIRQTIQRRYIGIAVKVAHNDGGPKKGSKLARDCRLAEEYLRRRKTSRLSDTALKASVGADDGLSRTASVDAINRGLQKLSG